ncbi:ATP-grasp fold amidoligase family protein [Ruminococcus flavefaciens]|uniref:ATP-grasp fold amidoligase family protein n=1 Tax=Ruminococcus flavefaciens TaxID=1265 RepID=UPI0026E9F55E|nr:ATP-grasp fold amidoligase family protein [Ruminococcus flavefaciens]
MRVKSVFNMLFDKEFRFDLFSRLGLFNRMSDKEFSKRKYKIKMKKTLNLDSPRTYNEKLQWLKLYYRNPLYTKLVDKYEVKKIVKSIIGEEYIIPTLGVWEHFDEIDFSKLPKQFVLKCTHDSGGLCICKDKKSFNYQDAKRLIEKCLKQRFYLLGREWPYKGVKPRIIAEPFLEDNKTQELRDYKFFVFDGKVKALFIASDRQKSIDTKFDFFDRDFNWIDVRQGHPNSQNKPEKPVNFDLMISLAEKLGKDMPHVRVDFYEVNGKVFFGEMTFFHHGGWTPFEPEKWDYIFGSWINLPKRNN